MNLFNQAWNLLIKALDPDDFTFDDLLSDEPFPKNNRTTFNYLTKDPRGIKEFAKLRSRKIDADLDMTARDIAPFMPESKWTAEQEARAAMGGGFSTPGKMLNQTYSLPTHMCKVGGRLREVPGSVCYNCYAHPKGNIGFTYGANNVQRHLLRNYAALKRDPSLWASALAHKIPSVAPQPFGDFRWHDSGDVDSPEHLAYMIAIAEKNPDIFNWIPTREWGSVRRVMGARGSLPPNLALRLSIPHIDQTLDNDLNEQRGVPLMDQKDLDMMEEFPQLLTTGVVSDKSLSRRPEEVCLTTDEANPAKTCLDARCDACYRPNVQNIDYVKH